MVNSPPASNAGPLLDGKTSWLLVTSGSVKVLLLGAASRLFACAAGCCTMLASPSTVCCKVSTCCLRLVLDEPLLAAAVVATGVPVVGSRRSQQLSSRSGVTTLCPGGRFLCCVGLMKGAGGGCSCAGHWMSRLAVSGFGMTTEADRCCTAVGYIV